MTAGAQQLPTAADVIARRRRWRQQLLDQARRFADRLGPDLDVRAVVVFGSVARGDFNDRSDIDVLVVAGQLLEHPSDRLQALGWPGSEHRVEPVACTPAEHVQRRRKRDPIAVEADEAGVWLVGSPPTPPASG